MSAKYICDSFIGGSQMDYVESEGSEEDFRKFGIDGELEVRNIM